MRDKIYEKLCGICDELRASLKQCEPPETLKTTCPNQAEIRKLLKNEPDFGKPIANPLDRKRKGNFMAGMFLLILTLPHAAVVVVMVLRAVPNELPHLSAPNVDDALPFLG